MQVKSLSSIPFQKLIDCFNLAFDGYFVKMPTEASFYENRWKVAKVDYNLSFGMFDSNQLVGFIINAVDYRNEEKIAYNTGTGVIPSYRGRKIVKTLYDFAIPFLKKNGINNCSLEVITENTFAIKAYQRIGFKICKTYKCYKYTFEDIIETNIDIVKINAEDFDWQLSKNEKLYSWDNQKEAIIIKTKDSVGLKEGIKLLIEDENLRNLLAETAYEKFISDFGKDIMLNSYYNFYKNKANIDEKICRITE